VRGLLLPAALFALLLAGCGARPPGEQDVRRALERGGVVELPSGEIEIRSELAIPSNADVRGAGTRLRASADFKGRAVLVIASGRNVRLSGLAIDGNRAALERREGLPPSNLRFADFTRNNGVLADGVQGLRIENLRFENLAGFAVLASRSREVKIERVAVADSGSRNSRGRNNATGGILLEDGAQDFEVTACELRNVRGNGIWTHSRFHAPRNARGFIAGNRFFQIGRDAIQVGHATGIRVERNQGSRIGYPPEEVDVEAEATPVALDTAGNTQECAYIRNRFEDVNGKCIDLDGFHHGEVRGNACVSRRAPAEYPHGHFGIVMNDSHPDTRSQNILLQDNEIDGAQLGGMFVLGGGHTIERNRLLNLNRSRRRDWLGAGIYLASGVLRPNPAQGNRIRNNTITGAASCILAAPEVSLRKNTVTGNHCAAH